MSGWITVHFPEVPDLDTRKAIIRWAEECLSGKFIPLHGRDATGRRSFGIDFQRADDAASCRRRWLDAGDAGTTKAAAMQVMRVGAPATCDA